MSSFTTLSTWLHFLQEWTATKDISILLVDPNLKWPAWLLPQLKGTQRTNYEKPLRDIFGLLLLYKDCLNRFFYHLEELLIVRYLRWKLKCLKILEKDIFISEIVSWTLLSKHLKLKLQLTLLSAKDIKKISLSKIWGTSFPWLAILISICFC